MEVGLWNLTLTFSEYFPVTQGGIGIRVCSFLLHSMLLHAWLPHVVSSPTEDLWDCRIRELISKAAVNIYTQVSV